MYDRSFSDFSSLKNSQLSPAFSPPIMALLILALRTSDSPCSLSIESLIASGEAVNMVLTEIPTLVDNILESNINQLQLLESKTKITDDDINAIEDQSEREERVVSPEEIRKSHGVDI